VLSDDAFYTAADIEWLGPAGRPPDWDGPMRALGCLVRRSGPAHAGAPCVSFNASDKATEFQLPAAPGGPWHALADTGTPSPDDICAFYRKPRLPDPERYRLVSRALAILVSTQVR